MNDEHRTEFSRSLDRNDTSEHSEASQANTKTIRSNKMQTKGRFSGLFTRRKSCDDVFDADHAKPRRFRRRKKTLLQEKGEDPMSRSVQSCEGSSDEGAESMGSGDLRRRRNATASLVESLAASRTRGEHHRVSELSGQSSVSSGGGSRGSAGSNRSRSPPSRRSGRLGRAVQRLSLGRGSLASSIIAEHRMFSVYLNDGSSTLLGHLALRPTLSLALVRQRLLEAFPAALQGLEFCFWYATDSARAVEPEDEISTRLSACLGEEGDTVLCIFDRSAMENDDDEIIQLNDEELRDLSPGGESVVRCCIRIMENAVFMQKQEENDTKTSLVRLSKSCKRFIKSVVRATVDTSRAANHDGQITGTRNRKMSASNVNNHGGTSETTAWSNIDQLLHQLQDQLVLLEEQHQRQTLFSSWWHYREHQAALREIISRIQSEFRASSSLSAQHSIFFFQFARHPPNVELLLDALFSATLVDFCGRNYQTEREIIANILGIPENSFRNDILQKKEAIFQNTIPFGGDGDVDAAKLFRRPIDRDENLKEKLVSRHMLREILAPQLQLQESFIDEDNKSFCPGTRLWAFEAFDAWVTGTAYARHRSFLFTGTAGCGKSSFASHIVRTRSEHILAYHFCRHDDHRFRDAKFMLLSIAYQLSQQSPHFERRVREVLFEGNYTRKQLLGPKCSAQMIFSLLLAGPLFEILVPKTDRFVILIDGVDEAKHGVADGSNAVLDVVQGLFHHLPPWVLFFFSTRPRLPILKRLRKFNALMVSPKPEQNDIDFKLYLRRSLSSHSSSTSIEELTQALAFNAEDSFLFCKLMTIKLKSDDGTEEDESNLMMMKLGPLLSFDFSEIRNKSLLWDVVKLCMVAMQPLQLEILRDLIGCDHEDLAELLSKARSFFVCNKNTVRFVHKVSKDWLLNLLHQPESNGSFSRSMRRLSFSGSSSFSDLTKKGVANSQDEVSTCHQFFAFQVRRLMIDGDNEDKVEGITQEYLLQHGVHHLALASMYDEAKELILNPAWLYSHALDLEGVVESCELLSEGDQLMALLARAVSLSGEVIREDPRQLIGQLVGRLIAVTDAAHGDDAVRKRMAKFLDDLRHHDYGYRWWCPLGPTWDQAEQPYLRTLVGHTAPVQSVAWHGDGRRCASGCWDWDIRIFDTLTGHCGHKLIGHKNTVWTIDWEPAGNRLVSGSLDRTVRIWNTETDNCLAVLEGHQDAVWSVKWSSDSAAVASGSKDRTIRIWNVLTGFCTKVLHGTEGLVYSVAWEGKKNSRICSGSTDNVIRVWDTGAATCVAKLEGHRDWVRSVDWCKTGRHIVSASADQTLRVWDAETFECEHVFMGHSDTVWSVSKSSDGRHAVSGSSDGTIRVWDCTTGRAEQVLKGHKGAVWSVAFAPDSKRVISGSADQTVMVWDASVGLKSETLSGHGQPIWCIDASRDGSKVVSGSADKTARLWNAKSGVCEKVFSGHTGPVFSVKLSQDGRSLATASSDNSAAVYRLNTGDRRLHLVGHTAAVWCTVWSCDDSIVFTGSKDMTVKLWDSTSGKCTATLSGHTKDVKGLSVSYDGRQLATASADTTIRVWDVASHVCTTVLKSRHGCLCVQWHPRDSFRLAAGYISGSVCVWDTEMGQQEVDFLPGHARRTNAVAWSPTGDRVVSTSSDKEVRIWNLQNNQCDRKVIASTGGLFGVVWKGNSIMSCGADKSIRLFNPWDGRCELVMAGENGSSLGILDMALSKDGRFAVSGSRQRIVQIWNAQTGQCERTLSGHTNWVHSVVFDESGKQVLSRSDDGTSRLWDVASGECLMVHDSDSVEPPGFVAQPKTPTKSLSAGDGEAVGVLCDKARVEADKACGWIGKRVYFFELMGKEAGKA